MKSNYLCDDNEIYDDYLNERLSISLDVNEERKNVIKYINKELKVNNFEVINTYKYKDLSCQEIKVDKKLYKDVFECPCEFSFKFFNIDTKGMNSKDIQILMNEIGYDMDIDINYRYNSDDLMKTDFVISGNVILYDMKVCPTSEFEIEHELKHAYMENKIYGGIYKKDLDNIRHKNQEWIQTYHMCSNFVKRWNQNDLYKVVFNKDFYNIIYSLYSCDKGEIDAFTQQAYAECENCGHEYKNRLKETTLYKLRYIFKHSLEILSDEKMIMEFEKLKNMYDKKHILPSIYQMMKLIERRYKKVRENYGKVMTLLKDSANENEGVIYNNIYD